MKRLCVAAPAFLGAFDFGLLALAGPRIAGAVGATGAAYPWLFSTSAFAYGACVLPAAALTARLGPARALAAGLAVAPLGLLALAAATALPLALAGRALFGVGGAVATTAALALLAGISDPSTRRSAAAALGGAVGGGFAAGALLASVPSWRAVLLALAAVCLLVAVAAARLARPPGVAAAPATLARPPGTATAPVTLVRPPGVAAAPSPLLVPPPGAPPVSTGRREPVPGSAWLALAIVAAAFALSRSSLVVVLVGLAVAGAPAVVGLRRASAWLPRPRGPLARACLAGAATTASGVSATILAGAVLADRGTSGAWLGVFGLAVLPGARLARAVARRAGHTVAAAAGLVVQAAGLGALAAAFALGLPAWVVAPAIVAFGVGHVAANAGAAGAVAGIPGPAAVGALLVAAQYLGGGIAPVLIVGRAGEDASIGVLAAALVALVGAAAALTTWPSSSAKPVLRRTEPGLSGRRVK